MIEKWAYFSRKILKDGYPFLQKSPLKMGRGFEAQAAHPCPAQIWVPPQVATVMITVSKERPFPTLEIRIIWVPLQLGPMGAVGGGGEELHICKIYGDVPPKWVNFTLTKSVSLGPILTPPKKKKIPKHGSTFVEKWVKNHGEKFRKYISILSKSYQNCSTKYGSLFS